MTRDERRRRDALDAPGLLVLFVVALALLMAYNTLVAGP